MTAIGKAMVIAVIVFSAANRLRFAVRHEQNGKLILLKFWNEKKEH